MRPYHDPTLPLTRIIDEWAAELVPPITESEMWRRLFRDVWLGHFDPWPWRTRMETLDALISALRLGPCKEIVISNEPRMPAERVHYLDGSIDADGNTYLHWPDDPAERTPAIVDALVAKAAALESNCYNMRLLLPGLAAIRIDRERFRTYCIAKGYALPRFWFAEPVMDARAQVRARFETFLRNAFKDLPETWPTKVRLLQEAPKSFPGLTKRDLESIWAEVAPADAKRSGPKSSSRKAG